MEQKEWCGSEVRSCHVILLRSLKVVWQLNLRREQKGKVVRIVWQMEPHDFTYQREGG